MAMYLLHGDVDPLQSRNGSQSLLLQLLIFYRFDAEGDVVNLCLLSRPLSLNFYFNCGYFLSHKACKERQLKPQYRAVFCASDPVLSDSKLLIH